ncbi:hypothetical protein L249_6904 [Ophiocordyceps polyrhachis-furcata BCC 54312]|uniref:Uncharacterized protein n=1 Tax=Ophiocordyceps polyrhachis-furcata BCC 54312 TaxID=1330021 RepID=A0A367LLF5_9HYPO|nr:hypothetical protein L249_6904 [Ophiocordyceps polyrhachis-furcata BCC 54312]
MGIVIAARELGKSDFLSVRHDFSMRKNVGKRWRQLKKNWRQERWENPPSFIDNFSGIKTCTCQSDRSDRSDPMTPAMTAMTRPLWPLLYL